MAESLGPASNRQVFSFVVEKPVIKEMAPPPPMEIKINDQGVQELTLVVTPGGYSPLRFAVKKGVPVRLTFRQLGQVGCGNELIFPANPEQSERTQTGITAGQASPGVYAAAGGRVPVSMLPSDVSRHYDGQGLTVKD